MKKISDINKEESLEKLDNDIHRRLKVELVNGKSTYIQQKQDKSIDEKENMKAWVKSSPIFNRENER